jgi:cell wall-associated NlpC family hydrolase
MKGVAVDCRGLVQGVAQELGLLSADFSVEPYPRSPDGRTMLALCDRYMTRIGRESMQPGDVLVMVVDTEPQHLGIVGDYRHGGLSLIHAASKSGKVIETRLMFTRAQRFAAAYALPGVA